MPWTSSYNATFTRPLVRQLMAIVQRDIRAALDFVGGVGVLPAFVSYQLAPLAIPQFPAVLLAPMDSVFVQEAVGSLQSTSRIYVAAIVAHQDAQVLAELVQQYIAALDAVFNSVAVGTGSPGMADFYLSLPLTLPKLPAGTMTAPLAAGTVKELFVASHVYDEIRRIKNKFAVAATLELRVDREET